VVDAVLTAKPRLELKIFQNPNSLPRNDLRPKIKNPKRFLLNLGHLFCYNQRNRILYMDIDFRGQLSDISLRKIGEEQVRNFAG
jgi:hypothetical protein